MDKKESVKSINKFSERLSKDFDIKKIIFFGSRATGNAKKHSDIDLIIVSNNFKKMNFFERVSKMYDYWTIDMPVDFLCYTEEEFDKLRKLVSIVSYALKNGIILSN
jgi:uncharacterized protein